MSHTLSNPFVLYYDPTSEPCRAVYWFALEAGIELSLHYTWLTRGDHRSAEFLAINPAHQVPALKHGDFCLSETVAILLYLAEIERVEDSWIGATAQERARTHRFMSWHHTNTRLKLTLNYFLPVLLDPAYNGVAPPGRHRTRELRAAGRESLELLDAMISDQGSFLGGVEPSIADLFIASDLFALDADPDRAEWFEGLPGIASWLDRLRERDGYKTSHAAWNAVVPLFRELLLQPASKSRDPGWVKEACLPYLLNPSAR